jgi:hypothetical protein
MAYIDDKLGRGEKVIYTGHQHIIVVAVRTLKWIGLFFLSLVLALWVGFWDDQSKPGSENYFLLEFLSKPFLLLPLVAILLISFVAVFLGYLVWQNEAFLVTNERVIKLEGVINKSLADSSLDKVNDVEMYQSLMGRFLGYGTIKILTGNEQGATVFAYLGNPNDFKRAMLDSKNGFYGDAGEVARAQRMPQPQYQQPAPQVQNRAPQQPPQQFNNRGQEAYYQDGYQQPAPNQADIPAMIAQLAKLRDAGAITEAEFQAKKNDLLRRL